jgi:hypothetical protein
VNKLHATAVAALVAAAVVLGGIAVVRTTGLGAASHRAADATVAAKTRQLAAYERRLTRALAARPPALPAVPKTKTTTPVLTTTAAAGQQRVVYHRPPPIVVVTHTHHGDDGGSEQGGGGDD